MLSMAIGFDHLYLLYDLLGKYAQTTNRIKTMNGYKSMKIE